MTRKLISLMHVSLDGFCAGPKGEMNWIGMTDPIFADVGTLIERSGGAVYGRTTYGMMHGYWPGMLTDPDASPRERSHARWVEAAEKHTFSRTLVSSDWNNVHLHKDAQAVLELKQQPGGDLLIFGSPGLTRAFLALDAIDEFWINLNPVLLGQGIRYLDDAVRTKLTLTGQKIFDNGVVRLNYVKGNYMGAATQRSVTHASFTITRHWKAAPARVFNAFADQAARDKWFANSPDMTRLRREFDFREGGHEAVEGRWNKTGMVSLFDCHYHDIVPPAEGAGRIICSYSLFLGETKISVSQQTVEIFPDGAGTKLVLTEYGDYLDGYDDAGAREHGTNGLMDALEKSLA